MNLQQAAKEAKKIRFPKDLKPPKILKCKTFELPGCRRVVFTDPSSKNTLDIKSAELLNWKLRAWEDNYLVKGIIVQGQTAKGIFSGGWHAYDNNPSEQSSSPDHSRKTLKLLQRFSQLSYILATYRKPAISWYNGEILDSGLGLGLTRYRISTESSSFQVLGPQHGWVLEGGTSFFLSHLQSGGLPLARYLSLTGATLSGVDMIASGLSTHHMDDASADLIRRRLGDLVSEPDHLVEGILGEQSSMFYKLDPKLHPDKYKHLWSKWAKNDRERERMLKKIAGVYDPESEEDDDRRGRDMTATSNYKYKSQYGIYKVREFKDNLMAIMDSREYRGLNDEDFKVDFRELEDRYNVRDEEDNEQKAFPNKFKKVAEEKLANYDKGDLWWHRNFAKNGEELKRSKLKSLESSLEKEYPGTFKGLLNGYCSVEDILYENFILPERFMLVDGLKEALSPNNSSIDKQEKFPEFMSLLEQVERCFKGNSLEEILHDLRSDGSSWSEECLKSINEKNPLSLKIVLKQLKESHQYDLSESYRTAYRIYTRLLEQNDDSKNGYNDLGSISDDHVGSFFEKLSDADELQLPLVNKDNGRRDVDKELLKRFYYSTNTRGTIVR